MSHHSFSSREVSAVTTSDLVLCSQEPARKLLTFEECSRLGVLPLHITQNRSKKTLLVASASTSPAEIIQAVRFATGYEAEVFSVESTLLQTALFEAYHKSGASLVAVAKNLVSDEVSVLPSSNVNHARSHTGDAGRLLCALLDAAVAQHASDLQMSPRRDGFYLTLRVQGERRTLPDRLCTLELGSRVVKRICIVAALDPTQLHLPQDGSFEMELSHGSRSVRVSLLPTVHGTQVALRFFGSVKSVDIHTLFTDDALNLMSREALEHRSGLIIVAGATGSGKTTTMYSFVNHLAARNLNVLSLEDPIEAEINGVSQTSIHVARGLTYTAALKSALRQDPDVIFLGEIRDNETAVHACEAALTGHLVLTTLHAGNVKEVLARMEQLTAGSPHALASLRMVLCQRLVRELCAKCRVLDLEASKRFSIEAAKAVGCAHCDYSGFSSRICIAEGIALHEVSIGELTQSRVDELEAEGHFCSPKKQLLKLFAQGRVSRATLKSESFDSVWG